MEIFGGILAAIVIAILISAIFYYAFNSTGPWGSLWSFFIVLLLVIWAANVWVRPVGPVYWGIAWFPMFFIGLIFALLLAAIPTNDTRRSRQLREQERIANRTDMDRRRDMDEAAGAAVLMGWIFWSFIIILFVAIIIGYAV